MSAATIDADRVLFLRYVDGASLAEVASAAGLTRQGMRNRWERHGWQLPERRHALTAREIRTVRESAEAGRTVPEIARETGLQRRTVAAALARLGVTAAPAPKPMAKPNHWRRLLGRLLNKETWRAILGPSADHRDRKRELHGLQRYCRAAGIELPRAAHAPLGRVWTTAPSVLDAVAASLAELASGPRPLSSLPWRGTCKPETLARHLLAAGCRIERPGRGVARIVHGPGGER